MSKAAPPFLPHDIRIVLRRRGKYDEPYTGLAALEGDLWRYKATIQARDGMNAPWQDIPVVIEE